MKVTTNSGASTAAISPRPSGLKDRASSGPVRMELIGRTPLEIAVCTAPRAARAPRFVPDGGGVGGATSS